MNSTFNIVSPTKCALLFLLFISTTLSTATYASFVDDGLHTKSAHAQLYPGIQRSNLRPPNIAEHSVFINDRHRGSSLQLRALERFPFASSSPVAGPMAIGMGIFHIPGFSLEDRLSLLDIRIEFMLNLRDFIRSRIASGSPGNGGNNPIPTPLPPALLFSFSGLLLLASRLHKCRIYVSRICTGKIVRGRPTNVFSVFRK